MFCPLGWCQPGPAGSSGPAQRRSKKAGLLLLHCRACRAQQTRFCSFVQTSRLGKIPPPGSLLIGWSADNQPMRWRESATTVEWDPPKSKFSRSSHLMGQRTSAGRLKQTYPVFPVATSPAPALDTAEISGVRRAALGGWWWLLAAYFDISCSTTACTDWLHCSDQLSVVCKVSDNLTRHQPSLVWLGDPSLSVSVANRIIHHPQLSQYQLYPPSLPPSLPHTEHSHRTSQISHVWAWLM